MRGGGCKTCPVKDCDAHYRGSQCAALRAKAGADSDPRTNADRIRAMSDEELGEFLATHCRISIQFVKAWLQQPAPEEEQV